MLVRKGLLHHLLVAEGAPRKDCPDPSAEEGRRKDWTDPLVEVGHRMDSDSARKQEEQLQMDSEEGLHSQVEEVIQKGLHQEQLEAWRTDQKDSTC